MGYMQHARRHLPGGTDPLPLTATHYIAGYVTGLSLASGTGSTDVDLDPATSSWGTEAGAETASAYLDLQQIGGTGSYGVTILTNGLYVADFWAQFNKSTAPAANSCAALGVSGAGSGNDIGGNGDGAPWVLSLLGTQYRARTFKRVLFNWPPSYGTPPKTHIVQIGQNSGATITGISVSFLVVYLGDGNTGF